MIKRSATNQLGGMNFFIPMVDLMVSAVFIFIIIVMILALVINPPAQSNDPSEDPAAAAAKGNETPVNPSIIEDVVANQTASEILVNDINLKLLKQQGIESIFDAENNTLEIKLSKPKPRPEK